MKKNVASQFVGVQMVAAADGSAFTGAVTVAVTGNAGTQATGSVGSGACTHEGNGYHTYAPAQAETNYDLVAFTFTGTGAVPQTVQIYTIPATGILAPTTLGRTLDVSAGGEAGIDWANVGTPGSTVSLSATTVANVSAVTSVAALGTGAITAASIATDAIDADALSTDAVNEIRNAITGGAYDLDTDANGRIRVVDGTAAGEINTASGVVQAVLADGVTHGGTTADLLLRDLSFGGTWNVVGAVVFDNASNDIRGITPTTASKTGYALSSTGMDAVTLPANLITASSIATDAIGAAELAADAATEIATAVWALATRTLTAATNISGPIADQVWEEAIADHSGTTGSTAEALNAAGAAGDPWTTALPGAYGAGSAGKIIGDNINATISSRASQTSVDTIDGIVDNILVDTAEIGAAGAGLTAADDAVLAAIAALNNLSSAQVTAAVWEADVNANDNTVGSFGDFFGQTYQAATVDIQSQISALNDVSATDVWAAATRTLTAGTNIQLPSNGLANVTAWTVAITGNITGNLSGSVGSVLGGINTTAGVITTLDALDTAQDTQHSTTQGLVTTADAVVDAIKVITDALGATAAARLALSAAQIIPGTVDSTAHTPTTTEFEADDITEATADHYNGRVIIFTSGALSGQATEISDYSLASGRGHFTVVALTEAPTNNGTFIIV